MRLLGRDRRAVPACRLDNSAFSLPSGGSNITLWTAITFDTDSMFAPDRIKINTPGIYVCSLNCNVPGSGGIQRQFSITQNRASGVAAISIASAIVQDDPGAITLGENVCGVARFSAGDWLTGNVYQDSGAAVSVNVWMSAVWIGPA